MKKAFNFHSEAGRCLGCGIIALLLVVIVLLLGYIFRREIEGWVYIKILERVESKLEQKKLPATEEMKALQKTFQELKTNFKKGRVERKKFWAAMDKLQKILLKEKLGDEDLQNMKKILEEIPDRVKKELAACSTSNAKSKWPTARSRRIYC